MDKARRVHRGHRVAELHADVHDFRDAERVPLLHQLLQRAPLDELHPQSDAAVDPIGAEDGDDVGVVDTREQAAFFDDGRSVGVTGARTGAVRTLSATSRSSRVSQAR